MEKEQQQFTLLPKTRTLGKSLGRAEGEDMAITSDKCDIKTRVIFPGSKTKVL